ncbi:MAG: hypothetical protein ABI580_12105 [Burkholderiaceae bacterium]
MKTKLASITAIAVLAGCSTTPFSYIDGRRYFQAEMNSYSVIVLDVDGRSDTRNPVMVEPGRHVIRVQAPAEAGFAYGETRAITLDVKPCTRYYLKAVKENQLKQDFEPKVDYVEPITGCTA